MAAPQVFQPGHRPRVEVLFRDRWWPGEGTMRDERDDGPWLRCRLDEESARSVLGDWYPPGSYRMA